MKEHVREGLNGFVMATGDASALVEYLKVVHTGELSNDAWAPR
jgi:hypothetical protein